MTQFETSAVGEIVKVANDILTKQSIRQQFDLLTILVKADDETTFE